MSNQHTLTHLLTEELQEVGERERHRERDRGRGRQRQKEGEERRNGEKGGRCKKRRRKDMEEEKR